LGFVSDTPGKTGTPSIEDVDEDSVKLSWTPPKSDGGDKVRGYVIEAKEKGSNKWKPLNAKSPCKDTNFTGTTLCNFFVVIATRTHASHTRTQVGFRGVLSGKPLGKGRRSWG